MCHRLILRLTAALTDLKKTVGTHGKHAGSFERDAGPVDEDFGVAWCHGIPHVTGADAASIIVCPCREVGCGSNKPSPRTKDM